MSKLPFGAPLYLYHDTSRPDLGMAQIGDVDEGLQVMQRGPIGRYRFVQGGGEREAWTTALYALTRAKFHPSGAKTDEARSSLRALAVEAGALVTIRGCETVRSAIRARQTSGRRRGLE
jgi:hypothetical protein